MGAEIRELEVPVGERPGGLVDTHRASRSHRLDACREMDRRPYGKQFGFIVVMIDRAEDNQAGSNAYAHLHLGRVGIGLSGKSLDDGAPAGDGFLRIPALGSRGTEISREAVAGMMGEDAAVRLHGRLANCIEGRQQGLEVLRVHLPRIAGGVYDVAAKDREMPSVCGH
jgi:hypothetical protein